MMQNKIFILLILGMLDYLQAGELKFDRLSIEDGLSENVVYCMLQDKKGFMWFGTHDGLNRYDGYTFKVFRNDPFDSTSLCHNMVTALHEDRAGRLWVGTYGGISLFDEKTETFRSFYHDSTRVSSLSLNQVSAICEDKNGKMFFGTNLGVDEMVSDGNFKQYASSNSMNDGVLSLFADSTGTIWVGTSCVVDTIDFTNHCLRTVLSTPAQALSIAGDGRGKLLIGTYEKLILYNTRDKNILEFFPDPHEKKSHSNNAVKAILRDSKGEIWLGTYYGLLQFDPSQLTIHRYLSHPNDVHSLSNSKIYSLCEDRSGVLWVGTFGGGISKSFLRQKKFMHYRVEPTESKEIGLNMIMSIFEDHAGIVWLGTWDKGILCLDRTHRTPKRFSLSFRSSRPFGEDSMGNIYSVEFEHVAKFKRDENVFLQKRLPYGPISCQLFDRDGSLWLGTYAGLVHLNPSFDVLEEYKHSDEVNGTIGAGGVGSIVAEGNDVLWLCAGGLNRFDKKTGRARIFLPDPENKVRLGMEANVPLLVARNGILWIGTHGNGLFQFNPATETFKRFTESDGLPNNYIYGILEDENGFLWLSTNKGLCRFDPNSKTCKNYDVSDGLQSNEFNTGAYFKNNKGELFFGGINGVNSFFPNEIENNSHVPNIVLIDFQVFNKTYKLENVITEMQELVLPYHQNFFSFEFAALDFVNPRKNRYRYMLEGFDNEWINAGTARVAGYTDVHPGNYIFRVLGSNNDGVWNEQGASVVITVTPPYWETWWFRTIVACVILGMAGVFYYSRVSALKRQQAQKEELLHKFIAVQEQERKRIAGELHDSLGQELLIIKNKALFGIQKHPESETRKFLDDISSTASGAIDEIGEIAFSLRPYQIDRIGLTKALGALVRRAAESSSIEFSQDIENIDGAIEKKDEINVYRIVQEGINNILKHSEATFAEITIHRTAHQILIRVKDNGKGFVVTPTHERHSGLGLEGLAERAHILKGTFSVSSEPGKGTTVSISIPISEQV